MFFFLFYNGIRRINHEEFKKVESEKELFSIWVKIMKLLNAANHKGASDIQKDLFIYLSAYVTLINFFRSLQVVQLYGPTNFSPVIQHVAKFGQVPYPTLISKSMYI